MPAKVKVRILAGRNLPVMDKSSDASDAFVEVKLGAITYKTEVFRRSLNPFWNSEWFRFEVCDQELQDEPLQIRVMDYDTYSANDAIGKVYINLNPLLLNTGRSMNGWLPIYDTLHGIRGEINVLVKVSLFADHNRFRLSSCGVRFFYSDVPNGYRLDAILGFVDELLVNDDPEYQWIDKIRTPRASNEARQTLFTKLSGEVQRKLGLKAEVYGGNAVIGYQQSLNLEGSTGIVGRGIGTAVRLSRIKKLDSSTTRDEINASNSLISSFGSLSKRQFYVPNDFLMAPQPSTFVPTERQLVHSVSADYFYQVPSRPPKHKRLSTTLDDGNRSTHGRPRYGNSSDLDYDDDDNDDDDNNNVDADSYVSLDTNSDHGLNRGTLSNAARSSSDTRRTLREPNRVLSSEEASHKSRLLFLGKLKQSNENIFHKLSELKRHAFASKSLASARDVSVANAKIQTILTKLLTHTRRSSASGREAAESVQTSCYSMETQQQPVQNQQAHVALSEKQSSSSVGQTPSGGGCSELTSSINVTSGGVKRRRDKTTSQTASSVDEDALSTIEEKLDDDASAVLAAASSASLLPLERGGRVRVLSEGNEPAAAANKQQARSAAKHRPFTRSREIDLSGGNESGFLNGSMPSQATTTTTNTANSPTRQRKRRSTTTSTADSSEEADEQIGGQTGRDSSAPLRRSDTDLAPQHRQQAVHKQTSDEPPPPLARATKTGGSTVLARSESQRAPSTSGAPETATTTAAHYHHQHQRTCTISSPDELRHVSSVVPFGKSPATATQSGPADTTGGSNFLAHSVGVVRAQQHLLANLVRHQNENLVANTMARAARNATTCAYPGRIYQSEYPLSTIKKYPEGWVQCTGGVVSVHSVKLLDQITSDEECETRDAWWLELRREIRAHAKALNCNAVLGYSEASRVLDDICILSARGTAAVVRPTPGASDEQNQVTNQAQLDTTAANDSGARLLRERSNSANRSAQQHQQQQLLTAPPAAVRLGAGASIVSPSSPPPPPPPPPPSSSLLNANVLGASPSAQTNNAAAANSSTSSSRLEPDLSGCLPSSSATQRQTRGHEQQDATTMRNNNKRLPLAQHQSNPIDCSFCHTPLHCADSLASLADCAVCCSAKVPDVVLLTIEPPRSMNIVAMGGLIQARVCRSRRDSHGEAGAKEIGNAMPFLEFELHRQLMSKLKFKGLNCVFNLTIEITVGDSLVTGVATGTACFLLGLPAPEPPVISAGKGIRASKLTEVQRLIALSSKRNRELLGLRQLEEHLAEYHRQLGVRRALDCASGGESASRQQANTNGQCNGTSLAADGSVSPASGTSASALELGRALHTAAASESCERHSAANEPEATSLNNNNNNINNQNDNNHNNNNNHELYKHIQKHHYYHHHHRRHYHHRHHRRRPTAQGPAEDLTNLLGDENNIILEVDDNEDADIISLLIDSDVPNGYLVYNSDSIPSVKQSQMTTVNMFTQVTRIKVHGSDEFAQQFDQIMQTMYVKLRRALPCCMSNLNFFVQLPESHVIQVTVTGCVVGLKASELAALGIKMANEEPRASATSSTSMSAASSASSSSTTSSSSSSSLSSSPSSSSSSSLSGSAHSGSALNNDSNNNSKKNNNNNNDESVAIESVKVMTSSSESKVKRTKDAANVAASNSTDESLAKEPTIKVKIMQAQQESRKLMHGQREPIVAKKQTVAQRLSTMLRGGPFRTSADKSKIKQIKVVPPTDRQQAASGGTAKATIEMHERHHSHLACTSQANEQHDPELTPTTRATIEAVKQEIKQTRLAALEAQPPAGTATQRVGRTSVIGTERRQAAARSLRTVFKKQQTYPGAHSPALSGQDNVLAAATLQGSMVAQAPVQLLGAGDFASSVARRATAKMINKVKQPLREIRSNSSNALPANAGPSGSSPAVGAKVFGANNKSTSTVSYGQNHLEPRPGTSRTDNDTLSVREKKHIKQMRMARSTSGATRWQDFSKNTTNTSVQQAPKHQQTVVSADDISGTVYPNSLSKSSSKPKQQQSPEGDHLDDIPMLAKLVHHRTNIDITSLSFIPNAKEYQYLGALSFSFIRETNSVRENGGLDGFVHCFLMEVYAIVRAHVAALGGNAFVSFKLQHSSIFYHSNKNQAQCLISVTGDACLVSL